MLNIYNIVHDCLFSYTSNLYQNRKQPTICNFLSWVIFQRGKNLTFDCVYFVSPSIVKIWSDWSGDHAVLLCCVVALCVCAVLLCCVVVLCCCAVLLRCVVALCCCVLCGCAVLLCCVVVLCCCAVLVRCVVVLCWCAVLFFVLLCCAMLLRCVVCCVVALCCCAVVLCCHSPLCRFTDVIAFCHRVLSTFPLHSFYREGNVETFPFPL